MCEYNFQKWYLSYRATVYTWNDKWVEFRVEYFRPGQSIEQDPAREVMMMLVNDEHTEFAIENRFASVVEHVIYNNGKHQTTDERCEMYAHVLGRI